MQGKNVVHLVDRDDELYCFRLHRDRVYYVSETAMRLAISVARPNLVSLGTCFGKFSKSGKFKLHITALDYLAQYAKYKVCCMTDGRVSLQMCLTVVLTCILPRLLVHEGLDQAQWRDAIPVRKPRPQSTSREDYGRYPRTSRRSGLQHERYTAGELTRRIAGNTMGLY